jgi:hypothetical protein
MRLLLLPLLLATPLAAEPLALRDGEVLTYRVGWGIFFRAGEIKISAQTAAEPPARLRVVTTTETKGLARALYAFEGRADALFDAAGRLLTTTETTKAPNKETKTTVVFDYDKSTVSYANALESGKDAMLPFPGGAPLDLITSLVQTRTWNLKPGEQRDAVVLVDDEFYELTIHALRYEEVETSFGTFNTLVLEPRMDKTAPKGMFKRGGGVKVWISQDELHLPVRFQVEFKFGSGVATLRHYQPPAAALAEAQPDAKNPRS